jgi:hypothetical protein
MTEKLKFQIQLWLVEDLEEFVAEDIRDGGVPKSWENMTSFIQDLMSEIRGHSQDAEVFSGVIGEVLDTDEGLGCGSDPRNPKVAEWKLEGYEYASHAWAIFEPTSEMAVEEWSIYWPEFVNAIQQYNQIAGGLGRLVISQIYYGGDFYRYSKAELEEVHTLLESFVQDFPNSRNTPNVQAFLDVVRNPAEIDYFDWMYLGELLACMPNLPSLHDISLVPMIETQLKNEVFEFYDSGFWNLVWLAKEIDLSLYEDED